VSPFIAVGGEFAQETPDDSHCTEARSSEQARHFDQICYPSSASMVIRRWAVLIAAGNLSPRSKYSTDSSVAVHKGMAAVAECNEIIWGITA